MLEEMAKTPAVWLSGQGEEALVVLSTRVRLARNIAGCKFPPSADSDTKKRVVSYFDSTMARSKLLAEGTYLKATDIEVGLLLNFGPKPDIKRKAFDNLRK